jgi:hypothetical protein
MDYDGPGDPRNLFASATTATFVDHRSINRRGRYREVYPQRSNYLAFLNLAAVYLVASSWVRVSAVTGKQFPKNRNERKIERAAQDLHTTPA